MIYDVMVNSSQEPGYLTTGTPVKMLAGYNEIVEWCDKQPSPGRYFIRYFIGAQEANVIFEYEQDALLFKLKFSTPKSVRRKRSIRLRDPADKY